MWDFGLELEIYRLLVFDKRKTCGFLVRCLFIAAPL